MSSLRLQQIEDLFHQALERPSDERRAFVIEACGSDEVLRQEVLSLLTADEHTRFLETPAADLAAGLADLWPTKRAPEKRPSQHLFWWFAAFASVVVAASAVFSIVMLVRHGNESQDYGWTSANRKGSLVIQSVSPQGPADGILKRGDRIIDINGDARGSRLGKMLLRDVPPRAKYTMRVERQRVDFRAELSSRILLSAETFGYTASVLLVGFVFAVVGLWVGFARPAQESARYFCLMAVPMSVVWMDAALTRSVGAFAHGEYLIVTCMVCAHPLHEIFGYWFCYRFPPGTPRGRFWSWVGWAIVLLYGCDWFVRRWNSAAALQVPWALDLLFRHSGSGADR